MGVIKCPPKHEIHCSLIESICLNVTFSQGSKGERGFPGLAGEKGDEVNYLISIVAAFLSEPE